MMIQFSLHQGMTFIAFDPLYLSLLEAEQNVLA